MRTICVWPDGCWCDLDELEEYEDKSDDFEIVLLSESVEDIDLWLDTTGRTGRQIESTTPA